MSNHMFISSLLAATLMVSAGAAMAANATPISKEHQMKIEKECKALHRDNATDYKTCVSAKEKALPKM